MSDLEKANSSDTICDDQAVGIEMAKQDRAGTGAVQGHIPMEQFAECMADIGA